MITKEEVLKALDIIEKYNIQERSNLKDIDIKSDTRQLRYLGFSSRILNALSNFEINTLGELVNYDRNDLYRLPNLGQGSIEQINLKLDSLGFEYPYFLKRK